MGFGFGMGNLIFSVVPVFIFVVFILVIGTILFSLVSSVKEWNKNNHSPRLDAAAVVVTKRADVSHYHHHHAGHSHAVHSSTSTRYYVTFQFSSGDRQEFSVSGHEYGMLAEGDEGTLSFQGTRFLGFKRG